MKGPVFINIFASECEPGWTYFEHTGECYKSVEAILSRNDASTACKTDIPTAHLVSIPDNKTNEFVLSMVVSRSWIGLENVANEWVWPDGTKATYLNFPPSEPSGDGKSVEIVSAAWNAAWSGYWNDVSGDLHTHITGYVCQYNPSGIQTLPLLSSPYPSLKSQIQVLYPNPKSNSKVSNPKIASEVGNPISRITKSVSIMKPKVAISFGSFLAIWLLYCYKDNAWFRINPMTG